ncbi:hypothetical protein ACWTU6_13120 [Mesorhizobium sp. BHbsci]
MSDRTPLDIEAAAACFHIDESVDRSHLRRHRSLRQALAVEIIKRP